VAPARLTSVFQTPLAGGLLSVTERVNGINPANSLFSVWFSSQSVMRGCLPSPSAGQISADALIWRYGFQVDITQEKEHL